MNSSYCKFLSLLLLQEVFFNGSSETLFTDAGRFRPVFCVAETDWVRFGKMPALLRQGVLRPLRRLFCGHAFYYIFCGQKMARLKEGIQN